MNFSSSKNLLRVSLLELCPQEKATTSPTLCNVYERVEMKKFPEVKRKFNGFFFEDRNYKKSNTDLWHCLIWINFTFKIMRWTSRSDDVHFMCMLMSIVPPKKKNSLETCKTSETSFHPRNFIFFRYKDFKKIQNVSKIIDPRIVK